MLTETLLLFLPSSIHFLDDRHLIILPFLPLTHLSLLVFPSLITKPRQSLRSTITFFLLSFPHTIQSRHISPFSLFK